MFSVYQGGGIDVMHSYIRNLLRLTQVRVIPVLLDLGFLQITRGPQLPFYATKRPSALGLDLHNIRLDQGF